MSYSDESFEVYGGHPIYDEDQFDPDIEGGPLSYDDYEIGWEDNSSDMDEAHWFERLQAEYADEIQEFLNAEIDMMDVDDDY